MNSNKLKLNPEKTKAMVSSTRHRLCQTPSSSMSVNGSTISYLPSVKYLGVTLDSSLIMERHISTVCRSTFLALRRISSIRPFLSSKSTATLVHATVTSRLDYVTPLSLAFPLSNYLVFSVFRTTLRVSSWKNANATTSLHFCYNSTGYLSPFAFKSNSLVKILFSMATLSLLIYFIYILG